MEPTIIVKGNHVYVLQASTCHCINKAVRNAWIIAIYAIQRKYVRNAINHMNWILMVSA